MSERDGSTKSFIGLMKGSITRYDDPFEPAIDPNEWEAIREVSGLPLREGYVFVMEEHTSNLPGQVSDTPNSKDAF